MKKGRLAPYILVSILIHAAVLIGTSQFLKLPAEESESVEFIPVEMVVVREEALASQPELVTGDRIWPKEALQTKSRIMMETVTDRSAGGMASPTPKAGGFEPSATMAGMATTGIIAEALPGENVDSKPIVPASQILSSPTLSVVPSAPIEAALLEVKMPDVFVEAEVKLTPVDSRTPQKVAIPLPASRYGVEIGFEPPALATKNNDEPHMNVAMVPIRSSTPVTRNGESVSVKPMIPASQILPSQVFLVNPSEPVGFSQLDVKLPEVLAEAKAKPTPADSQTPQKVAIPLPASRYGVEIGFEAPAIAKTNNDVPHITLDTNPALKNVPRAPRADTIAVKLMILASQMSLLQLSPADPSPLPISSPIDVRMPAFPIAAKAATIPTHLRSSQKIEKPLASRRSRENLAAEHQPVPKEGPYEPVLMVSTLQVQSQPNGAQVYVNGMLIGQTPLAWELPLGKHEVRLTLPDYYEWEAQIELTPEHKTLPIRYRLVPIEETK